MTAVACPACGEDDALSGRREGDTNDTIVVTCGACGHEWQRGGPPECETCGTTDLEAVNRVVWEKSRGDQMSIVGSTTVHLCPRCDAGELASLVDGTVPKLPGEFRKGDLA